MKKIVFILLAVCLSTFFVAAQKNGPAAKFDKVEHNFGKIEEKEGKVTTDFSFTNTGKSPLIINRVQASCGCTTPEHTKDPVLPGKKGFIKVTYSTTGRVGAFNKKITVFSNAVDTVYTLTIKGEVIN